MNIILSNLNEFKSINVQFLSILDQKVPLYSLYKPYCCIKIRSNYPSFTYRVIQRVQNL